MCILHTERVIDVHVGYILYLSLQGHPVSIINCKPYSPKEKRGCKSSSLLFWINEYILFRMRISLFSYITTFKEAKVAHSDQCIAGEMRNVSLLVMVCMCSAFFHWWNKYLEEIEAVSLDLFCSI